MTTQTTATRQPVTIRVQSVGQNFGICGLVVSRNGRVLASTDTVPTGMRAVAEDRARALAAKMGLTVREAK